MNKKSRVAGETVKDIIIHKYSFSFFSLLAMVLIILKLTGDITIGWGWIAAVIFAPLIILFSIVIFVICIAALMFSVICFCWVGITVYESFKE